MKKHVLFLLFALLSLVLISCAGQDTDQDTEQASEGLEMKLSEDGTYYEVSGIGDCKDSHIVIPSEYKEKLLPLKVDLPPSLLPVHNSVFENVPPCDWG